ncbi:lysine transporter LysE [Pandoraea terrae]|uniref:Lysine transporter LysE n=1 Tax=Pandoraea terrae TaxID=1537710 RepID=A0A5E4TSR8_9BURK|nr:LysE family translocator [Pandoraea terrae]VVD90817.1 lysine transporter LysE [Pandoraea terrae]
MHELLAVMMITVLAVVSPGADFAMVTRNSWLHGRRAGLWAAAGIALGVQVHVAYTLVGVGVLIKSAPWLFTGIKLVGAAYLVYIGWQTLTSRPLKVPEGTGVDGGQSGPAGRGDASRLCRASADEAGRAADRAALRTGFLTNALNPKTTLFVVSTFTQVVQPGTGWSVTLGYGAFMSLAHWVWFSVVALGFSQGWMRAAMVRRQKTVQRTIGGTLMALGTVLATAGR